MPLPEEQLLELALLGEISVAEEGGTSWVLIQGLQLPSACTPDRTDGLLCPTTRDGYPSRLYFADQIRGPQGRNWNGNIHVLGRNWYAISWRVPPEGKRLIQILSEHLDALR